jgi:gas vesicle protein
MGAAPVAGTPFAMSPAVTESTVFIYLALEDEPMKGFKFLMAVMGGALVGASAALLYAPASGRDTRKQLSKRLDREKKVLAKELGKQRQVLVKKGRAALDDAAEYLSDELSDATRKIVKMVAR